MKNNNMDRALPTIVCGAFTVLTLLMVELSGDNPPAPRWAVRSWAICLFVTAWFTSYSRRRLSIGFLVAHPAAALFLCLRAFTGVGAPEAVNDPLAQAIDATVAALGLGLFVCIPPCAAIIAASIWHAQRKESHASQSASAPLEQAP